MTEHPVLIVGAGPTGMMLAAELALANIDVAVIERRPTRDLAGLRAGGLHPRTLEILDQRGVAERFISQGQKHASLHLHVPLHMSELPTRHNYVLALTQNHIERILADWVEGDLAVPIQRGCEVVGFVQDDSGVEVTLSHGERRRVQFLVGCDGGRSRVRKAAGIGFPGWDATTSWLIAEAQVREEPPRGFREDAHGTHAIGTLQDGRSVRVVLTEPQLAVGDEPTVADLREELIAIFGTDFGVHDVSWISRFTDLTRQAERYRAGRVLLAGDAAHVHPPMGGQGLNVGLQEAVNLGWKLAQVIRRQSPVDLLDTYHTERHPVAACVLRNTMVEVALRRTDERSRALRESHYELLSMVEPSQHRAARLAALDVSYAPGGRHPLVGRRIPDLDLVTREGPRRIFSLLHRARPVLINFAEGFGRALAPWESCVEIVDARCDGAWELPLLGRVLAPPAVLIRPDGYVAWVGECADPGLAEELLRWVGSPVAA
ncbi:MAG: FAD-dependent monooxygenase [Steroidobacteraceae bacterium]